MTKRREQPRPKISHVIDARACRLRPGAIPSPDEYVPIREVSLREAERRILSKEEPPRADGEMSAREDHLRSKWTCNDPMPGSFDPSQLDAALRSRGGGGAAPNVTRSRPESAPTNTITNNNNNNNTATTYRKPGDAPAPTPRGPRDTFPGAMPTPAPPRECRAPASDSGYDSEPPTTTTTTTTRSDRTVRKRAATVPQGRGDAGPGNRGRAKTDPPPPPPPPPPRPSTPRIRAGSKPPLSASAFSHGQCRGPCARVGNSSAGGTSGGSGGSSSSRRGGARPRMRAPRAPDYFPFTSRMAASRSSRARERERERAAAARSVV
ncbi:hypothetical protein SAMD00023353_5200250 [Rosellinia necatrix]|uniref:Uncharacterized protein n=1 Tax=Rosellinia necatrix TaxID=77044 RepID=A0A1W2TQI0_ROSNE|nr:hypothetical protein SAMD00023353_5200250 [Rosellinia necatrix]